MSEEKTYAIPVLQKADGEYRALLPDMLATTANPYGDPPTDSRPAATPDILPNEETDGFRWAPWGRRDCLPGTIRKKFQEVPIAGMAIEKMAKMMYGNGISYYRNQDLVQGNKIKRAYIPAVERFIRLNRINTHFLIAQFMNYRHLMCGFSELIFSRDRKQITNIYHKEAEFCRLSVQNTKNYKIEYLYYSPDFQERREPLAQEIRKIHLYDWKDPERFLEQLPGYKFAWYSHFPTPGMIYYPDPIWLGLLRENGWLEVSKGVPEVVNSMLKNQIILKYHILIPESYMILRNRNWNTSDFTDEQRRKAFQKVVDYINASLKGTKNAFTSIASMFREDPGGNPVGKIEIIALDDKIKKDSWVPSSDRADAQIVQSLGLHPSQVGLAPEGGKMGAGSGSDQRESFNTGISLNTLEQDIILEPLNWLATFNAQTNPDWDITFFIDHTTHTTTNQQEDGLQASETTIEVEN